VERSDINSPGTSGWKQLDSARLLLSLIVVVAHANYVFMTPLGYTATFPITEWMARYAVLAFFVLSGLVIGRSLALRRDGFVPFMLRRVGRIYPPLVLSIVLVVAIDQALRSADIPTNALPNAGLMTGRFSYDLRSIALCMATFGFRGTVASEANGPLWSLVIEMRCYVAAGLLAQIGLSRTALGKVTCIGALACVLSLMAYDRHLHPIFTLSYAAFAFGLVLSLVARQIPQVIPAVPIDVSYSLYILHMPIMLGLYFVFYQPSFPALSGALALSCAAIGSALALSLFSARFIEPFRGQAFATACEKFLAADGFRFLSKRPPICSASFEGSIASD